MSYTKSALYLLGVLQITFANARTKFSTQSTYLHPIGGTEVEHVLGRKNAKIVGTFELVLRPSDSWSGVLALNKDSLLILRLLGGYKKTGISAFFISPEIITTVKIHDYEVTNSGKHPNQPIVIVELREVATFKKVSSILSGIILGGAAGLAGDDFNNVLGRLL